MTMRVLRRLPCFLTFMRIALTPVLLYLMFRGEYGTAFAVFAAICLTDVLDGAAARSLGACTRFGASMDVAADLIYIISSLTVLCFLGLAPYWFAVLVLFKFVEFRVTSFFLRRGSEGPVFIPDLPGRISAGLFFVIPGVHCLFQWMPFTGSGTVITILLTFTAAVAVTSCCLRILLCLRSGRLGVTWRPG